MFGTDKASSNALINVILFQGVWFLTVLGASAGNGWIGTVGLAAFFIIHYVASHTALADFRLAALAVLIGAVFETVLLQAGLISYAASIPSTSFAPLWLLTLWAAFALTLNGCLAWLHGRYWLAGLLGAIGGPLSYFGGAKLGAATSDSLVIALAAIAACYALVTPALFYAARRFANHHAQ